MIDWRTVWDKPENTVLFTVHHDSQFWHHPASILPLSSLKHFINTKHLKNVGPIHHCEPPHAHSADVASSTVARRLRIDVHDNADDNDNARQRGPLWPHGMGPTIKYSMPHASQWCWLGRLYNTTTVQSSPIQHYGKLYHVSQSRTQPSACRSDDWKWPKVVLWMMPIFRPTRSLMT